MEYPTIDTKATGERIKELLRTKKVKKRQIADFMGFESEQAIYKWQRGDSLPTVDNLYALSRRLNVTMDDIIRGNADLER